MKEYKGVTLIVLVITIIIMLILVAVTVSIAMNEGLFNQAMDAKTMTDREIKKEELSSILVEAIDNMGMLTVANVKWIIEKEGGIVSGNKFPLNVTYKGEEFTIMENGIKKEGTDELPQGWDSTKVANVVTETIEEVIYKAPVPVGFVVSGVEQESKISNGLVIYQMTEEQKTEIDWTNGVETARQTYNQYVWVPIVNPSNMYGTDINGNKLGKLYSTIEVTPYNWIEEEGVMTWQNVNTFKDTVNLTGTQTFNSGTTVNETTFNTDTTYIYDSQEMFTLYGGETYSNTMYQTEFNEMIASVEKYGGFYIGRYETGGYNENEAVIQAEKIKNSINNATWYTMYNKTKTLSTSSTTAHMIWGCQYDQMLIFAECGDQTTPEINERELMSGKVATDCYKNIYDLCGNVFEWTMEACRTYSRVCRGGCYCSAKKATYRQRRNVPPQCK